MKALDVVKVWAPSALSMSILTVELPIIASIVVLSNQTHAYDYMYALGMLMFFNAFVFPLCTFVVSNKGSFGSLRTALRITVTVFLSYITVISLMDLPESLYWLLILFSLSILAVGGRRILQGKLIYHNDTYCLTFATIVRVIASSSSMFVLFYSFEFNVDYAAIIALTFGAYLEALVLFGYFIIKRYTFENIASYSSLFSSYAASFFMSASVLMSNYIVITAMSFNFEQHQLAIWGVVFPLLCVLVSGLIDLDSIFINLANKMSSIEKMKTLAMILSIYVPISASVFYSLNAFFYDLNFSYVAYGLALCVPAAWGVRSLLRADLVLSNSTWILNGSIALAMFIPLCFALLVVGQQEVEWMIGLYSSIVLSEVLILVAFTCFRKVVNRELIQTG